MLREDTLNKWTYLHAVVLIGAWSTRAAPANKMLSTSSHDLNHMFKFHFYLQSPPFPLSSQHPLTVFFWPYSCFGRVLCSFHSWFNWSECLICTIPPRSAGNSMCISYPLNLTGAGDIRCLYFCVVSVPHICTTAEQSFRECKLCVFFVFFQHLVFMCAGVCVYVRSILEDA